SLPCFGAGPRRTLRSASAMFRRKRKSAETETRTYIARLPALKLIWALTPHKPQTRGRGARFPSRRQTGVRFMNTIEGARAKLRAHIEAGLELTEDEATPGRRELKDWWANIGHAVKALAWELAKAEDSSLPEREPADVSRA